MSAGKKVALGFELQGILLPLSKIRYVKQISKGVLSSSMYKSIVASVREIGIIEPPIVHPQDRKAGIYNLLDGHLRVEALKELGVAEVFCLISTDDEGYTYNKVRIDLSPIQRHFMIRTIVANGVTPERISSVTTIDLAEIRKILNLLHGICPDAVGLLKNKPVTYEALQTLKKVRPIRQIEMAELMVSANDYSSRYALAMYGATPVEHLVHPDKAKAVRGLKPEDLARMEREMERLTNDYKLHQETFGQNELILLHVLSYVEKLLNHGKVVRFLSAKYPEMLQAIQGIVEAAKEN